MRKKVYLFGASTLGEIAFNKLKDEFEILNFIDNNADKQDEYFCNLKVISLMEAINEKNHLIIICSMYDVEMAKQLLEIGIKSFAVFKMSHEHHHVSYFDYTSVGDFSVQSNKICLLVQNHSGSNSFALSKLIPKEIESKHEIIVLSKNDLTPNYYYDMITSHIVITTHDYRCAENQINIQFWHGIPLKGISYMSNYSYQDAEANHRAWSKLDYIVSSSQTVSTLLNACYGVESNKYKILGYPRNDLMDKQGGRARLESIFNINLNNKKNIFYMPTYRLNAYGEGNGTDEQLLTQLSFEQLKRFNTFLEYNDFYLFIKLHPEEQMINHQLSHIKTIDEKVLKESKIDLYELLGEADLLITDYSSVYFDFLLLDRPIIFFTPDIDRYKVDRGFLLNPIEFWMPGEIVYTIEELQQEMLNSLFTVDKFVEQRRTLKKIFHQYQDSQSGYRAWKFIDEILDSTSE
ncbi:CDP-glycerol glycerophosphotransferase family protein [Amphibacillus sp. Q70]|uniref:CDP-glycerol glycerophosphotransferase family protein n=1 Tax=Amphibacillus sp. Q70 TaxID=3453416 RepID=UPI003F83C1DC